jgi:hypothetical protein
LCVITPALLKVLHFGKQRQFFGKIYESKAFSFFRQITQRLSRSGGLFILQIIGLSSATADESPMTHSSVISYQRLVVS